SMNLSRRQIPRQHQQPEKVLVPIGQLRRCRRPARRRLFCFDFVLLPLSIHPIHFPTTELSFWKMSLLLHVTLQSKPNAPPRLLQNSPNFTRETKPTTLSNLSSLGEGGWFGRPRRPASASAFG